jgi:hypothetical protein
MSLFYRLPNLQFFNISVKIKADAFFLQFIYSEDLSLFLTAFKIRQRHLAFKVFTLASHFKQRVPFHWMLKMQHQSPLFGNPDSRFLSLL